MGKVRKKKVSKKEDMDTEAEETNGPTSNSSMKKTPVVSTARETRVSSIGNKMKRMVEGAKLRREKKKAKRARRSERHALAEELGDDAPPRLVPKTIDSMRTHDVTFVRTSSNKNVPQNDTKATEERNEEDDHDLNSDDDEEDNSQASDDEQVDENNDGNDAKTTEKTNDTLEDAETEWDITNDEFANYFEASYAPKVLITSADNPHTRTLSFIRELSRIIPNSEPHYRRRASLKKTVKAALSRGFTDLIVINEDNRKPNGMVISHLPDGPTAHFRLSNVKTAKDIKKDWRKISAHRPEVILNNFQTRLGHTVARMLAALFHYEPNFQGRRCVTFHNQRDYIFFRHHMYDFKSAEKVRLRDLGPRFTLKLRSLQKGSFDSKTGEFVWIVTDKRHQLESNRRTFHL